MYGRKGQNHPSYGHRLSDEQKKEISERMKGEGNHQFGKKQSEETIRKRAEKMTGENHFRFGKKRENATSKYYGVNKRQTKSGKDKFIAGIRFNGKSKTIGTFNSEIEAAKAYDSFIVEHLLPNPLNFYTTTN